MFSSLPLPILAINTKVAGKSKGDDWRGKLAAAHLLLLPPLLDGWTSGAGGAELESLRRVVRRNSPLVSRDLALAPMPDVQVYLYDLLPRLERQRAPTATMVPIKRR